jgi:hypothetical protein
MSKLWEVKKDFDFSGVLSPEDAEIKDVLFPLITVTATNALPYLGSDPYTSHTTTETVADVLEDIEASGDDGQVAIGQNKAGENLGLLVQDSDTPLQEALLEGTLKNSVDYRRFRSIDVNESPDGIYYKNIESAPENTIDKVKIFNFQGKEAGENIFSENN